MQFLPDQYLQPFIRHYLFLESTQQLTGILRLFTDGSTGIVFSLQGGLTTDLSNKAQLPTSFYMVRLVTSGICIPTPDFLLSLLYLVL